MASSVSGQDEPNRALWLATRARKMEPSCPLGTTRCIPQAKFHQKPYNKSFIDQVCSVKMAGYWPRSFFASLWTSTSSRSINTQKKNLANIQPSWPHTCSITHTYDTALTQLNTTHYNVLCNMFSWEFKLAWSEACSKNRKIRAKVDLRIMGDGGSGWWANDITRYFCFNSPNEDQNERLVLFDNRLVVFTKLFILQTVHRRKYLK